MSDREATQLLPLFVWRDPRAHLLDDIWLLTIAAIVLAIALPWSAGRLRIDFGATAAGLLTLAAIHVGFAVISGRAQGQPERRILPLSGLHAVGVLAVAFIWQHAGALENPLFLAVFALPVVGAIFLSRWQPYLTATLAAAVVGLVAVGQAPQLRWYAPALSAVAQWLEAELGGSGGGTGEPFAGFYAPSEYFVVLLDVFAVMVFACAVAAEYLASIFERLHAQLAVARAEAVRGQELWFALLEQLPLPAFLVDPDTGEIVCASASARAKFFAGEDLFAGSEFFTAVNFSYPEPVQELLLGAGGVAAQSLVRLGEQLRATEVSVQHVARDGRRFALVIVQDTTESLCVKAALDVAEHAAIVVDAQGRVRAWNKPAMGLFSAIRLDADISHLLPEMACAACWWDPGLSGRRKSFVQVMQRVYQLTSSAVPLPGEDERLYVVAFVPAAHVVTADQEGSTFTTRIRRP